MNSFLRLLCCTILLGLWGCQGLKQGAIKAQDVQRCNITCIQHFEFCKKNCVDNCPTCSYKAQRTAEKILLNTCMNEKLKAKK